MFRRSPITTLKGCAKFCQPNKDARTRCLILASNHARCIDDLLPVVLSEPCQISNMVHHCVTKQGVISGPYFPVFGLNTRFTEYFHKKFHNTCQKDVVTCLSDYILVRSQLVTPYKLQHCNVEKMLPTSYFHFSVLLSTELLQNSSHIKLLKSAFYFEKISAVYRINGIAGIPWTRLIINNILFYSSKFTHSVNIIFRYGELKLSTKLMK